MGIVNVRIDERMVHGIVATFWLPRLKTDRVVCIDDESANSPMIKSALRMATPGTIFLSVITLAKAIENFQTNKYGKESVMIIAKTPDVLLKLLEAGVMYDEITLGNLNIINKKEHSKSVTNYLSVDDQDVCIFDRLHEKGIKLTIQLIPDDTPSDFYNQMKLKY